MALLLSLKHILIISLLSLATYGCEAQQADSVQIVARAALCFDNQTVTSACSRWMRRVSTAKASSPASACRSPCFGQMMLVLGCVDGILSNFQFYSPGLMQGVQSIFQMSCGGRANTNANATVNNTTTNTSASGNMVVKASEEVKVEKSAEKPAHRHWSSVWIILIALAAVIAALVLYVSPGNIFVLKEKLGFATTTEI